MPLGLGIGLGFSQSPVGENTSVPSGTYTAEDGATHYTDESGNSYVTEN